MAVASSALYGHSNHIVQFYGTEDELAGSVGEYIQSGLRHGDPAIVIATPAHVEAFEARLAAAGVDVASARDGGTLVTLDAEETIARFLVEGRPDPAAFDACVGELVRRTAGTGRGVRAYGEMVAILWESGDVVAALELEKLWNDLLAEHGFLLFCAYPRAIVEDPSLADAFGDVCALHTEVRGGSVFGLDGSTRRKDRTRRFMRSSVAPRDARHFTADTLRAWGDSDLIDEASIIVSELCANAVIHAKSNFEVNVSAPDGSVRISVRDSSSDPPRAGSSPLEETSGRGLVLVKELADRWGTDLDEDGKIVWAELRRRDEPGATPDRQSADDSDSGVIV